MLGKRISVLINTIWSCSLKPIFIKFDHLKLQGFKVETIKQVNHKGCVFNIYVNPENGFLDQYIYLNGVYEDHILSLILKHLPFDGVFMDIGANIGLHSLFAACLLQRRGGKGKVYAFEPVPKLRDQLLRSIALNGFENVQTFDYAVGNENKSSTIFHNMGNMGASSLVPSFDGSVGSNIQIKRLDDEFGTGGRVHFIKIDVEGYECQVIDGAKELISAQKPVLVIEFSFGITDEVLLRQRHLILQFLFSIYSIFDIEGGDSPVRDVETFNSIFSDNERKQANLLCLPK